ncbi:MAG: transglycosylase SLT domain-containing protein, partial [Deltaproteobacteria bacterium]|nr:transglycosylase SLT domain-containing protein [Deltaproteobacteria bacterium]
MRTSPTAAPAPAAAGSGDRPAPRWTPPKAPQDPLPAAGPVPVAETTASPPPSDLDGIIRTAAATYDLPEAFLRAVITVESGYKLRALSHKGAMGLMQLMPGTARDLGVSDPWD